MHMFEELRSKAYSVLTSPTGDRLPAVHWSKRALLYWNDLLGRPLASADEFRERYEYRRAQGASEAGSSQVAEVAPVVVYHRGRYPRELEKIRTLLRAEDIPHEVLNIADDEASLSAVAMESRGFPLPVVFIAGTAIGGAQQLANLSANRELAALVWPS